MHRLTSLTGVMATLAMVLAAADARAQVVPFQVTGGGVADYFPLPGDPPAYHDAAGTATFLGEYTGEGFVRADRLTGKTTGEFSSARPFVFTAANGDELAFDYGHGPAGPGTVELVPVGGGLVVSVWTAEFTPAPAECTGRFARVAGGSVTVVAITDPFVPGVYAPVAYTWSGDGWLEFTKP